MTNDIMDKDNTMSVGLNKPQGIDAEPTRQYPTYDEIRAGKLVDEVIATIKDDRSNTKRAISADIASTARVQNQNDCVIAACEKELQRRDLSDERRNELLDRMSWAAETTAYANANSREFLHQQLDHSHKLPWKIILFFAALAVGGISSTALTRATA